MIRWTSRRPATLLGTVALAAGLASAGCDAPPAGDGPPALQTAGQGASTQAQRQAATAAVNEGRRTALVEATSRVAPAVVSITVTSRQRIQPRSPWENFFVPEGSERLVQSYGTGFVARANGVIITNQHVVAGAERILVTLSDGTEAQARVLGEDPTTDIAILRVERTGLPVAPVGRSADLMIGEWVLAMGNPYTFMLGNSEPTVTAGVVSATGRDIIPSPGQPGLYLDMIQTDAAINPGNSGGPLTNALGEVVGVNSSILSSTGGSIGLGFAIPIERALGVAEEILRTGSVRRAWTGLDVAGPEAMRDWRQAGGVVVTAVAPGGPAARAGVREGDVLVEADGRRLRNYLDWEAVKLDLHVGDSVVVSRRAGGPEGAATRATIVTGDLPSVTAEKVTVMRDLQLLTVTPAIQAERGLRSESGALVFRLSEQVSRATGLATGDVIIGVNRAPVRAAEEFAAALEALRRGQPFRITFERRGQYLYTDLVFR